MEKRPQFIFKICLLGEGGVGKTCLARRLCFNTFDMDTKLTIGIDFYTYDIPVIIQGSSEDFVRLTIWDFGGQEAFKRLFPYYINGANGLFMVFDLADMNTMQRLDWWYEELFKLISEDVPRILIGCKQDLLKKKELKKDKLIIDRFMDLHGESTYVQTSSKDNYNVKHIFHELTKLMLKAHNISWVELG